MTSIRQQVQEFHLAFDQPSLTTPKVPDEERVRLRARLITEEYLEMMGALFNKKHSDLSTVRDILRALVNHGHVVVDLPELADALADLDYVVEGTRQEFGITGEPIARAVHASNMAKLVDGKPVKRADGKIRKPEGWTPPDIAGELRKQGWEG